MCVQYVLEYLEYFLALDTTKYSIQHHSKRSAK